MADLAVKVTRKYMVDQVFVIMFLVDMTCFKLCIVDLHMDHQSVQSLASFITYANTLTD